MKKPAFGWNPTKGGIRFFDFYEKSVDATVLGGYSTPRIEMKLHFQIDPNSGFPVYRQVVEQVKYYITSGALQPGAQLPSVRELAQRLSINPATVVKAYAELEAEGLLENQQGRGAFICESKSIFTQGDKEKVVRRLARQLAVESLQLGASQEFVEQILSDEWEQLSGVVQARSGSLG